MEKSITEPRCENCAKPLFGRTDKRFCNDSCRNEFNRKKRAAERIAEYENLPEILKIIKKNYEILRSYKLETSKPNYRITVDRSELLKKGYHFKFFTSIYKDNWGQIWKFCFDYGIRETLYTGLENECQIIYKLDQIEIHKPDTYIIFSS